MVCLINDDDVELVLLAVMNGVWQPDVNLCRHIEVSARLHYRVSKVWLLLNDVANELGAKKHLSVRQDKNAKRRVFLQKFFADSDRRDGFPGTASGCEYYIGATRIELFDPLSGKHGLVGEQ